MDINQAPHRCDVMGSCLDDPRVPIDYRSTTREYVVWLERPTDSELGIAQQMLFCPWCGTELPAELTDQLHDELEALAGGDLDDFFAAQETAPEKYHSAAWWHGRYDEQGQPIQTGSRED